MKIKNNIFRKLLAIAALVLVASCSNTKGWIYKPNDYKQDNQYQSNIFKSKSVAVLPFSDKRSNDNSDALMLYALPLSPLGYQNLSSPETTARHVNSGLWVNFNPKEDFAKGLVEELGKSEIFAETFFANSIKDSQYYINGEIISMEYKGKMFSYGLSIYGPLLWYFGLPASHISNDLEIKLSLMDSKLKKEIFSKTYKADQYKKLGWIYNLPNDFYYPEMLRIVYQQFVNDVKNLNK